MYTKFCAVLQRSLAKDDKTSTSHMTVDGTLGSIISKSQNESEELTSREKQEHEDSGHAVYRSWCAACVDGRGAGGQHRIELLEEERRLRS